MLQYPQMARKRGPKTGQFDFMCGRTLRLIASLADTSYCNAGDAFLAKKLDCSTRSIRRYVKKLRDDGKLTRTTVAYMVQGGWRKKRLMKTRFERHEFGLTRFEVLNWKRPAAMAVVAAHPPPKKVTKNPYFEVLAASTIEGFGDPFHGDLTPPRNPRPCDTLRVPATEALKLLEMLKKRAVEEARPTDPEYTKLSIRYIRANLRRNRTLGQD